MNSLIQSSTSINIVNIDVKQWIKVWVSQRLAIPINDIQMEKEFSYYGLDSMAGLMLALELEALLGVPVPPTIIWDCPNLNKVAGYILKQLCPSAFTNDA